MSSTFITNQDKDSLKERLIELVQYSEELKFLVGFFYLSGIQELYEPLKEKVENNEDFEMKILVGLEAGQISSQIVEYGEENEKTPTKEAKDFIDNLVETISHKDFDREEFYKQVEFFLELIKQDKLQIKKTVNPNHAKLYIFKMAAGHKDLQESVLLTGSSNLTKSGLTGQEEFNVELSDFGVEEAEEEYFDELWGPAIDITQKEEIKQDLIDAVENKSIISKPTPFEAFTLTLKTYLETTNREEVGENMVEMMKEKGYKPYKYQIDAVEQALSIIEENSGAIIADVVGLGKSVIASLTAKKMNISGRGLVICPPALMGDRNANSGWRKYLNDFNLYGWEVRSVGKLEEIEEYVQENDDIDAIIVDEAHRFKNEDTQSYEHLSNICKNKKVMLLTATPFNNAPDDIFSLLKLFIVPKQSSITLSDNAESKFAHYQSQFEKLSYIKKNHNSTDKEKIDKAKRKHKQLFGTDKIDMQRVKEKTRDISNSIRNDIEPVTIRRNRIDLKEDSDYQEEIGDLPEVKDPKELFYDLTSEQMEFYEKVVKDYFGEEGRFNGAIYRPYWYEANPEKIADPEGLNMEENREYNQQKNLYNFMRRLVVKRFESSFGAFKQSIINFKEVTEAVLEFIDNSDGKYVLDRDLVESMYQEEEDEIEERLEEYKQELREKDEERSEKEKVYHVDSFVQADKFKNDIKDDLQLFDDILDEIERLELTKNDPKIESLAKDIEEIFEKTKENEPKRKVVVFSEYMDTIKYLKPRMEKYFPDKVIAGIGNISDSKVDEILSNFDAGYKRQEDEYDILLATDKLSEGINLNRAGAVINYDIPWNPTTVIQRLGRINRIGTKVFDDLYIYNSFPTERGSDYVRSKQIAKEKMFLIHNTLGEDVKIFDPDEEPTASDLYTKINQNPEEEQQETFFTKVKNRYKEIKENHPEVVEKIKEISPRVKTAMSSEEDSLSLFIKKGQGFYVRKQNYEEDEVEEATFSKVYDEINCTGDEQSEDYKERLDLSNEFWDKYQNLKEYKEEKRVLGKAPQSIRSKAKTNLNNLKKKQWEELEPYKDFVRDLLEDMHDYGTLPKYTLRRIANIDLQEKDIETEEERQEAVDTLQEIKDRLGENYLEQVKQNTQELSKEVIIAIEQQSDGQ